MHFGNIIFDEAGKPHLIDVSMHKEQEKSVIEFEAAKILMSFYQQIIRNNEYNITKAENGELQLKYTERGLEILQRRQQALDAIMKHPDMQKWFVDKQKSRFMIELSEALCFVTIFNMRPKKQQLGTYVLGTRLLEQAIKNQVFCNTAIFGS